MSTDVAVAAAGLFLAGLLAGEEVAVRYGVRGAIDVLDDGAHIELRQALIRRLRVLVPALALPASVVGVVVVVLARGDAGGVLRLVGLAGLLVWMGTTFGGTVPINAAALEWDPASPPADWRALVERWERLNTVRCWAAVVGFAGFLVGLALQLSGS